MVRKVTKNLIVTDRAPEFLFGDGQPSLQNSSYQDFIGGVLSKRHMTARWGLPKGT
jgi:hypothetical protein